MHLSRKLNIASPFWSGARAKLPLDDHRQGASAAYSLYDLGNRRGTVTETGETVYGDFEDINASTLNGGFENVGGGGADVFADWDENATGSSTVNRDTSDFTTGSASCRIDIDGSSSFVGLRHQNLLTIGEKYEATFRAKATSASVQVEEYGSSVVMATLTTEWVYYTHTFTATSVNFGFKRNFATGANQSIWVDDVVLTNIDTYRTQDVTYHNPAVRLRRDSDNIHKSFPAGAFTQMQNWANEDVETYASDFSAGVDGWGSVLSGAIAGNIDGIGGRDDCLRFTTDSSTGSHRMANTTITSNVGASYLVTFDVYVPSSNATLTGVDVRFGITSGQYIMANPAQDTWVSVSVAVVPTNDIGLYIYLTNTTGDNSFTGNGTDVIYIRNVTLTQLTSNAYATTWYDQSGVQVVSTDYQSDFTVDTDGWSQVRGTNTGNIDGVTDDNGVSKDDCLRYYANADAGTSHYNYVKGLDGSEGPARITFEYYVPSGQTSVDGLEYRGGVGSATYKTTLPVVGEWANGEVVVPELELDGDSSGRINFLPTAGGSINFTGQDDPADDSFYLRNVKVELLNKAHNDATQTTADNQPKVVDAGVLVTDANGNYSLDFDGVDDHLTTNDLIANIQNSASIVICQRRNASTGYWLLLSIPPNRLYLRGNQSVVGDPFDTVNYTLVTDDTVRVISLYGASGAYETFVDGTSEGTSSTDETGGTVSLIGSNGSTPIDGQLSAIIIYPTNQSANRSAIEQSLSNILTTALS